MKHTIWCCLFILFSFETAGQNSVSETLMNKYNAYHKLSREDAYIYQQAIFFAGETRIHYETETTASLPEKLLVNKIKVNGYSEPKPFKSNKDLGNYSQAHYAKFLSLFFQPDVMPEAGKTKIVFPYIKGLKSIILDIEGVTREGK